AMIACGPWPSTSGPGSSRQSRRRKVRASATKRKQPRSARPERAGRVGKDAGKKVGLRRGAKGAITLAPSSRKKKAGSPGKSNRPSGAPCGPGRVRGGFLIPDCPVSDNIISDLYHTLHSGLEGAIKICQAAEVAIDTPDVGRRHLGITQELYGHAVWSAIVA